MTGEQFIKRVRRAGRRHGVPVRWEPGRGKGSHGRLYYGERFTTVKDRKQALGKGLLNAMLRQLNLSQDDI